MRIALPSAARPCYEMGLMASPQVLSTRVLVGRLWRSHIRANRFSLRAAMLAMVFGAAATAGYVRVVQNLVDDVLVARDEGLILAVSLGIVALGLVQGFSAYVSAVILAKVGQGVIASFQSTMFGHLVHADLVYFDNSRTGVLISRFTNDVNLIRQSLSTTLVALVKDSLTIVFLLGLLFYEHWLLTLIVLFVFPSSLLLVLRIGRRIRRITQSAQTSWGEFTATLEQAFVGIRHIKAYGLEERERRQADAAIERIRRLAVKAVRVQALSRPIMEFLGAFAVAAAIYYGGAEVAAGTITPGTIVAFLLAFIIAYRPVKNLVSVNAAMQQGLVGAQRCFELLDRKPEIVDAPDAAPLRVSQGEILFDDVCFSYSGGPAALSGLSLVFPAGRTSALVGASGAGKTTILNLIPRFYDVTSGRVAIDGQDLRGVTLASLRANIALVSQEVSLFDDTVYANIACGRAGAGEDEVKAAARDAGAQDFIEAMPDGFLTRVGEFGVRLSGGQRQRIAIARAMLKDAPILLLDEATSALDTETERLVQAALERLKQGRTTVAIAHRLSTVANADVIHVIDKGRVVESGAHGALLAQSGVYARLHALQFAGAGRRIA